MTGKDQITVVGAGMMGPARAHRRGRTGSGIVRSEHGASVAAQ
jgi:hypothetical protein